MEKNRMESKMKSIIKADQSVENEPEPIYIKLIDTISELIEFKKMK